MEVKKTSKGGFYRRFVKRPMDFIFSLFALIFLSPLLITIAVMVRVKLGPPVLFKQLRPGLNEKLFTIYKFRTMTNEMDNSGRLLNDSLRLTKFGGFLRSTSIDELPELYNILRGDMSFVGPRPLLKEYLHVYTDEEKRRHSIRPGLTGYAQVNGRNDAPWETRLRMDIDYVEKVSLFLDIKILAATFLAVIKRKGVQVDSSLIEGNLFDIRNQANTHSFKEDK